MIPSPRQPVLPPSASSIVAEVNFAVTRSGLEGQLLGVTLQFEQPELEKQKSEQLRREEEVRPLTLLPLSSLAALSPPLLWRGHSSSESPLCGVGAMRCGGAPVMWVVCE